MAKLKQRAGKVISWAAIVLGLIVIILVLYKIIKPIET
jgi:hypothetical protein